MLSIRWVITSMLLIPSLAHAATINQVVSMSASSHMSEKVEVNGVSAEVVYVGQFEGCDSVAIVRHGKFIDNYRACNGKVIQRDSVSPSWEENREALSSVVNNAIYHGAAQQTDESGYLISAHVLGAVSSACKNIEVIVSYDGDLVDHAIKEVCK